MALADKLLAQVPGQKHRGISRRMPMALVLHPDPGPASTGQHIVRSGTQAAALTVDDNSGLNAPLAQLGDRDVADSSTASYKTGNHLPANPSADVTNTPDTNLKQAVVAAHGKAAKLKAQGVHPDLVHEALAEDLHALVKKHGLPGRKNG